MQIRDSLSVPAVGTVQQEGFASAKGPVIQERYENSIVSMRRRPFGVGEMFAQLIETVALIMLFPVFVYTFFLVSVSIVFLPFLIILAPFFIALQVVREVLHCFLPWIFPVPYRNRY